MIVYRCRVCGYVLYVVLRVGQDSYGVPTPSEVIRMYGGVCPRCGHRLGKSGPGDITVAAGNRAPGETDVLEWIRGTTSPLRHPHRQVLRGVSET